MIPAADARKPLRIAGASSSLYLMTENNFKESGLLKLNCDKALSDLKWEPVWNFQETIFHTVNWYKSYYEKQHDILKLSIKQIEEYSSAAKTKNLSWTNV